MRLAGSRAVLATAATFLAFTARAPAQCLDWQTFPSTWLQYSGPATAIVSHDDGSGPALYIGAAWSEPANNWAPVGLRRWNGAWLEEVGGGLGGRVNALLSAD